VAFDGEHAGLIVQLLGHVLPDALHLAAAGAQGVVGLMTELAARQFGRQGLALGSLVFRAGGLGGELLQLALHRLQVFIDSVFEKAALIALEHLAAAGELHPLEHCVLVRELVDGACLWRTSVSRRVVSARSCAGDRSSSWASWITRLDLVGLDSRRHRHLRQLHYSTRMIPSSPTICQGRPNTSASSCTRLRLNVPST